MNHSLHSRTRATAFCALLLCALVSTVFLAGRINAASPAALALPTIVVAPNAQTTVALAYTHGDTALVSADLRITWDPAVATLISAQKGSAVSSWTFIENSATPGLLRAGMATGSAGLSANADLLLLTFQGSAQSGVTALTIAQASLNEGAISVANTHGSLRVNRPPLAVDDSFETPEDTLLTADPGVATGDSDHENDTLTFALATQASHGTVTLAADGSFTYQPTANYFGADSFTYTVSDPFGGTDTGTATIAVQSVNDAPTVLGGGPYAVDEGGSIALAGSANDVDHASGLVIEWDLDNNGVFETTGANPTYSAAALDGPSSATVKVRARDPLNALSSEVSVSITVNNVAPTANPGGPYAVQAGGSVQLDGTASSDPAGAADPLTYAWDLDDDGVYETSGATPTFDASSLEDTVVTIRLRVTDDDGAISLPVATTVAIGAAPTYNLSGAVRFWNGMLPMTGVSFALQSGGHASVLSGAGGAWSMLGLAGGSHTIAPDFAPTNGAITAYDAALVLQHAAQTITLDGYAATAANVNKTGDVSALDASLILQHSVGLIPVPFVEEGEIWEFDPPSRSFTLPGSPQSGQDFTAVLLGDPSGNWPGAGLLAAASSEASLRMEPSPVSQEGRYTITLSHSGAGEISSIQATVYFPGDRVSVESVSTPWEGALIAVNDGGNGVLHFAVASAHPMQSGMPLLEIVLHSALSEAAAPTITNVLLDETSGTVNGQHSVFAPIVTIAPGD